MAGNNVAPQGGERIQMLLSVNKCLIRLDVGCKERYISMKINNDFHDMCSEMFRVWIESRRDAMHRRRCQSQHKFTVSEVEMYDVKE